MARIIDTSYQLEYLGPTEEAWRKVRYRNNKLVSRATEQEIRHYVESDARCKADHVGADYRIVKYVTTREEINL